MPYNVLSLELKNKIWLMYLRKSRQDDPNETVEEVLAKHQGILQEWARRELGREIPADCIYREVVSGGESIEDREEMQKVLRRIEDPNVAGVLCVDPQRLTRGSLQDCGVLISTLLYTKTLVATPMMVYDMSDKMHQKFFESELMRGRDFLDYTKEILWRGRVASVKRGCFIGSKPPYGYNKVSMGKDHTLEPNEGADVVRLIFDLYANQDYTYYKVACHLNSLNIPSPQGIIWKKETVRRILMNVHYDGKVAFNQIKETMVVENGERIMRKFTQPDDVVIIAEGKHPALVDHETFQKAQDKLNNNHSTNTDFTLQNPLAGVLYCKGCGLSIMRHPYKHAADRLQCRSRPKCFKSIRMEDGIEAVITALEHSELPELQARAKNGDGHAVAIQKKLLEQLEKKMVELREQEEKQYDLLETGVYTQARFEQRNTALRQKMEELRERIYKTKATMPKEVDYEEKVITLKKAIEALKDPEVDCETKNKLLKSIVKKIELSTTDKGHNQADIHLNVIMRL